MLPQSISDNDESPPISKKPTNTTPQRTPAVKRRNGTSRRKVSANKAGTPNSAPPRARPAVKKQEPTLLGDFLLGRPSVNRPRRRSLDVVKAEMREAAVNKIQPPGGVKDRVQQWQKASAAAVIEDPSAPATEPDENLIQNDGESADETARLRIKFKGQLPRPVRRQDIERDNFLPESGRAKSSPRKRVVSDDHWMNRRKSLPRKLEVKVDGGSPLPKDFLKKFAVNPPLEKKIEDWAKRTEGDEKILKERHSRRASKASPMDDGIRVFPSRSPSVNEDFHTIPMKENAIHNGTQVKPVRSIGRQRSRTNEDRFEAHGTPSKRSERNKMDALESSDRPTTKATSRHSITRKEPPPSWTTPSPSQKDKSRPRKSRSTESLAEVPFGYSAFSVLDLPVGADASAMRRLPRPQRTPSLSAVPKVLKKVYNEGLKIVHDTVDPPRSGLNQPPSIESWLKGTSDPFVDQPYVPESVVGSARPEYGHWEDEDGEPMNNSNTRNQRTILSQQEENSVSREKAEVRESSETLRKDPHEQTTPPSSPTGLKRTYATRSASSPFNSAKKTSFREALVSAFRGESESLGAGIPPFQQHIGRDAKEVDQIEPSEKFDIGRNAHHRKTDDKDLPGRVSSSQLYDAEILYTDSNIHKTKQTSKSQARRDAPTIGQHRLSTIASVETFNTTPSLTDTSSSLTGDSELSQTTVTQNTANTANTENTSHVGYKQSNILRKQNSQSGLKRRLTKHSDLLSVLSLPDAGLGSTKSIRSARSVRTNRSRLATATISSLLQELADDEVKYMRELRTLVDGVIPVLLTCVLSKSDSAIAAGLFNPLPGAGSDGTITKPIVDMGVSLERLKSLHRRTPLQDPDQIVHWAAAAHKVYQDYLTAWRMGFQDVIVNLAPASPSDEDQSLLNGGMSRNAAGDVLNEDGERVDVAFLLKRPLVRIKYLAKLMKGIHKLKPSDITGKTNELYQGLLESTRRRTKEEEARLEDQIANNTDGTRARDPKTLAPMESVMVNRMRQVNAKDFFDLDILHSNGQRIGCRVELLLRDKPNDDDDPGDILICEVDHLSRWLLFPPIELDHISARRGDSNQELVVMIRGSQDSIEWRELLVLTAEDEGTANEWVQMVGSSPLPPPIENRNLPTDSSLLSSISKTTDQAEPSSRYTVRDITDIPIGERRSRIVSRSTSPKTSDPPSMPHRSRNAMDVRSALPYNTRDLNDAMAMAGSLSASEKNRKLYRSEQNLASKRSPISSSISKDDNIDISVSAQRTDIESQALDSSSAGPNDMPIIPKQQRKPIMLDERGNSTPDRKVVPNSQHGRSPSSSSLNTSPNDDVGPDGAQLPPLPPAHKSPNSLNFKKPPILDAIASRFKNRRSSSPLKHEYQPSDASGTSSASEDSDSGDGEMDSDSSEEEELEAADPPRTGSGALGFDRKVSPVGSLYSFPNASLAPSQSASQAPYHEHSAKPTAQGVRLVASISCWSDRGHWKDLYPEDCSIVVGAGLIEAFVMSASHSGVDRDYPMDSSSLSDINTDIEAGAVRPLVALELTPCVPLRQSNALDIEIRSPPTAQSKLKCTHTVRFRSRTLQECSALYAAIHQARMNNPVYKRLEQERIVGAYGGQSYQAAVGSNRRISWFGRKRSYRASTRAPSATISDNSTNSFSSAIARLRNIGGTGGFNIDKSSVATHRGPGTISGGTSLYTSSSESATSNFTPPRTPTSPSIALTGTSNVALLGRSNLKIRLYILETSTKWNDLGSALLTVSDPPRGMRQASSLYHGVEKRIVVMRPIDSKRSSTKKDSSSMSSHGDGDASLVLLDVVLGGGCFSRLGVVGIAMNVWEDIVGDNGEIGKIAAVGGVSGRTRKWMFQCASAKEAAWIFSLVGGTGV